jgi:phosphoglycerate dehydrogenase-like enzyme
MTRVALLPAGQRPYLVEAIQRGGGTIVDVRAAQGLVWTQHDDPAALRVLLDHHPHIQWVQLPWAGIEPYRHVLDGDRLWTAGQGVYADDVAEHALAMMLAMLRHFPQRARASSWGAKSGVSLVGKRVCILGAGGIAQSLVRLAAPFGLQIDVVRRQPQPFEGAEVWRFEDRREPLSHADVVVVACALTSMTTRILDAEAMAQMKPGVVIVNVARGGHIDTDALVAALSSGHVGGAALDVTDPEPLPPGHPLWSMDHVLVTPHTANTDAMAMPVLSARVEENVRRFGQGLPLLGVVDVDAGY